jgi:hypothetical protein
VDARAQKRRTTRLAGALAAALGAFILVWSAPALAGPPHDLSSTLSRSGTGQAAMAPCLTSTPAIAACATPLLRAPLPFAARCGLTGDSASAASGVTALNWVGYDANGSFTSVAATWVEPAVAPGAGDLQAASFWVGLDGDGSATAEQIGTAVLSRDGQETCYAWYEMYPQPEARIATVAVAAGDTLTASVITDGQGSYTLALSDETSGATFSTTQAGAATTPSSAEIVAEAPTDASLGRLIPLAGFDAVPFSGCAVDGRPLGATPHRRVTMVASDGSVVAGASELSADGAGFTVSRCAADTTAPTTTVTGADGAWHDHAVAVMFTATDDTGVAYTEFKVDQGPWTVGSSLTVAAPADHANDGLHTILYRSVDVAGNREAVKVCTVGIDTAAPTPAAMPATVVRGRTAALAYSVVEEGPVPQTATVTITVRTTAGRLVKTIPAKGVTLNTRLEARFLCRLAPGRYRYAVAAIDAAGNVQTSVASNTLTVH